MGKIALVRIDSRLIHGQVCTQWLQRTSAKKVIIIDDDIRADPYLYQVFKLATPVGIELEVLSAAESSERWDTDGLGKPDPIMILVKDVPMLYKAYNAGCKFEELQVGGIGGGPGRVNVVKAIALDKTDWKMLGEMSDNGLEIYFQMVPDDPHVKWGDVKSKYSKDFV